jgi:protein gp37
MTETIPTLEIPHTWGQVTSVVVTAMADMTEADTAMVAALAEVTPVVETAEATDLHT